LSKTSKRGKRPVTGYNKIITIILRDKVSHPYLSTLIVSLQFYTL